MFRDDDVVAMRGGKHKLDPGRPYHFLHETEPGPDLVPRSVNTIFLTNKECPFKCVMCDLWKHTLDEPLSPGVIPQQITYALDRLPGAEVIKLYNNGNFFDPSAIPVEDYPAIAELLQSYERVIVENHPKIGRSRVYKFRDQISCKLEIAIGVETIHPEILPRLNKKVSIGDINSAAEEFNREGIDLRAFVLMNPPFLTDEKEIRDWCLKTIRFSFKAGFSSAAVIPVRTGNGVMEHLQATGRYVDPDLDLFEEILNEALSWQTGRIFADTWDLEKFEKDPAKHRARLERLEKMNQTQIPQA